MIKSLNDTVDMMLSDNYKERFKAEYYQLKIRYNKLSEMIEKWDAEKLNFKPTCPRSTYNFQLDAMREYLDILKTRGKMEGIEL